MDKIELSEEFKKKIDVDLKSLSREDAIRLIRVHEEFSYYLSKLIGGVELLKFSLGKHLESMDKEEKNRYEKFDNSQVSREVKNLEFKLIEKLLDE